MQKKPRIGPKQESKRVKHERVLSDITFGWQGSMLLISLPDRVLTNQRYIPAALSRPRHFPCPYAPPGSAGQV